MFILRGYFVISPDYVLFIQEKSLLMIVGGQPSELILEILPE